MKIRFATSVVGIALALVLGAASPAMARGGGGGGGGGGTVTTSGCAQITSWTPSVQTIDGQSRVVLDVGIFNGCVDAGALPDKMPAVGMTETNTATGAYVFRSVIMASYGQMTYRFYLGAPTTTPPALTVAVDVTKPNGQVQDVRRTTLADIMQAALATQPAA
jgi:hypothetical protein